MDTGVEPDFPPERVGSRDRSSGVQFPQPESLHPDAVIRPAGQTSGANSVQPGHGREYRQEQRVAQHFARRRPAGSLPNQSVKAATAGSPTKPRPADPEHDRQAVIITPSRPFVLILRISRSAHRSIRGCAGAAPGPPPASAASFSPFAEQFDRLRFQAADPPVGVLVTLTFTLASPSSSAASSAKLWASGSGVTVWFALVTLADALFNLGPVSLTLFQGLTTLTLRSRSPWPGSFW